MALLDELEEENRPLIAPFSGDAPAGADPSFLPGFEAIKAEVDKLGAIAGGNPDWKEVGAGARTLLQTAAKDWRLACWFAIAEARTRGSRGLATGLHVISHFSTTLWTSSLPEARRARGRANLYAWLTDQLNITLEAWQVTAADREALTLAEKLFRDVDAALSEKLADAHPGPGRMRNTLANLVRALPADAPPPPPPPPPAPSIPGVAPTVGAPLPPVSAPPPRAAPAAAAPPPQYAGASAALPAIDAWTGEVPAPPTPRSAAEAAVAVDWGREILFAGAGALRKDNRASVAAYRVHRNALWVMLELPGVEADKRTWVDPPRRTIVEELDASVEGGYWDILIDEVEHASKTNPYWLDLQRLCATALDRLGHRDARAEVGFQVVKLVQRMPALLDLEFSDGRAFAAADTVAWIRGEMKKYGGTSSDTSPKDDALEAALRAADAMASEGRLGEGLNAIVDVAFRSGSGRERFRALLRAGRLAMERGAPNLARPMLDGLVEDALRHGLESWDPALCVELYFTLIQAIRAETGANVDHSQREAFLFEKLCRLDPATALVLARG